MIISHKNKFIFIKPTKVAGTSVEIALAKHCGEKDIITPITSYNPRFDDSEYNHQFINYEKLGYYNHICPHDIKQKIGKEVWNKYFKFTVVRNPWDQAVSRYFWNKERSSQLQKKFNKVKILSILFNPHAYIHVFKELRGFLQKIYLLNSSEFERFILTFNKDWTNTRYYFDKHGKPLCDYYMRYENLEEDYKNICNKLGIPYEKLPKTKNKQRKGKKHYSKYYNKKTKAKIKSKFKKEINFFNYKFK